MPGGKSKNPAKTRTKKSAAGKKGGRASAASRRSRSTSRDRTLKAAGETKEAPMIESNEVKEEEQTLEGSTSGAAQEPM